MDVFQWADTLIDSIRKNTVAATIEMEMIQNEMATASLGSRKPWRSLGRVAAAGASVAGASVAGAGASVAGAAVLAANAECAHANASNKPTVRIVLKVHKVHLTARTESSKT